MPINCFIFFNAFPLMQINTKLIKAIELFFTYFLKLLFYTANCINHMDHLYDF